MNAADRAKAALEAAAAACLPEDAKDLRQAEYGQCDWLSVARVCEYAATSYAQDDMRWALCRAAASACVEAWQASRSRAEVREEVLAALRNLYDAYSPLGFLLDMQAVGDWIRHIDKLPRVGAAIHDLSGSLMREPRQEIRSACSRAARALLLWREVMEVVAGE